jgi:hypothetical protein
MELYGIREAYVITFGLQKADKKKYQVLYIDACTVIVYISKCLSEGTKHPATERPSFGT